jgi:hypothetical protein
MRTAAAQGSAHPARNVRNAAQKLPAPGPARPIRIGVCGGAPPATSLASGFPRRSGRLSLQSRGWREPCKEPLAFPPYRVSFQLHMRALLYHLSLGEMDGTSVVLRRLYAPVAAEVNHLYFRTGRFPVPGEFPSEFVPGEARWRWRRGARRVQMLWRRFILPPRVGSSRWVAAVGHARRENRLTSVHVVVYDETAAQFARLALEAAGTPRFTLHLMDLLVDTEISPHTTPHLCWLLARTAAVVSVSRRLLEAVRPFFSAPTLVWPIPSGAPARDRTAAPSGERPWQVLMGGAMYAGKAGFLEQVFLPAWKQFQQARPNTELVYIGKDIGGVPDAVRTCVRPLGVFPPDKVGDVLREASVALLPILHEASTPWRYSVPARISDYLAAGLPVLAPHSDGTATHDFLLQAGSPATTLIARQEDALRALHHLHDSPADWLAASRAATAFARKQLDLERLRPELLTFMGR